MRASIILILIGGEVPILSDLRIVYIRIWNEFGLAIALTYSTIPRWKLQVELWIV